MTSPAAASSDRPTFVRALMLGAFLIVTAGAAFVGNLLQGDDVGSQYLSFERPAWAPPQEAFGIVWPILYVLIGLAAWRAWYAAGGFGPARLALGLWAAQLVVNAIWPGVFFGGDNFGWAAVVILVLDVLVIATILAFRRHDALAGGLLAPYLLWILYASALNIAIWQLN